MKVLLSFNEAYAPHGAAVITGLIRHSSQKLSIVVLYHELSEETIQKFTSFYSAQLETIEFIKVTVSPELEKRLKEIRSSFYLKGNIETWLRIFASSYIQDDYVVWLDCDIVVTGDICKILEEVDNQYFVSACKEYDPLYTMRDLDHTEEWASLDDWRYQMIYDAHYFRTYEYYDIPYHVPYFCAGIMYMNLKKWREEHLESQLLEKIYEYDYIFALDQDVLNSVIKGRFGVISPKWNTLAARPALTSGTVLNRVEKSSMLPAPPEAMTGTRTASQIRSRSSRSKPPFTPSVSMELATISPAPRATPSRIH